MTIAVDMGRKATKTNKQINAGGSIQFYFTYIPDRINHLIVGKIKFDTYNIR